MACPGRSGMITPGKTGGDNLRKERDDDPMKDWG